MSRPRRLAFPAVKSVQSAFIQNLLLKLRYCSSSPESDWHARMTLKFEPQMHSLASNEAK